VQVHVPIAPESQHYMRTKAADALHQNLSDRGKVLGRQATVGMVEHLTVGGAQYLQSGRELLPAQLSQFIVAACVAPVRGRSSFREAHDAAFDASLVGQHQGAAKGSALIIRVGSKTHQPQRQVLA
jgi:hypothetical protein